MNTPRRSRKLNWILIFIFSAFLLPILLSRETGASSTDFELFLPTPVPEGGFQTESARLYPRLWTLGSYLQLEKNPVVLANAAGTEAFDKVVYFRWQGRGLFTFNFFSLLQASVDFPFTLLADQKLGGRMDAHQIYLNDMILRVRYAFPLEKLLGPFHLGISAFSTVNTGNAGSFGGSDYRFLQPGVMLLGEYGRGRWFARVNLGYQEKDKTRITENQSNVVSITDRFLYRVSLGTQWLFDATYFAEYAGSTQTDKLFQSAQHDAQELYLGVQKNIAGFILSPGLGLGLSKGFGVPAWRIIFGIFYPLVDISAPPAPVKLPPGRIVLSVQDPASGPLPKSKVSWATAVKAAAGSTNAEGKLEVEGEPGTVSLRVEKEGYYPAALTADIVAGATRNLEVSLRTLPPPPGRIYLSILDENARPLAGARVFWTESGRASEYSAATTEVVLIEGAPGPVAIRVEKEGFYPAALTGDLKSNINISLEAKLRPVPPSAPPRLSLAIVDFKSREPVPDGVVYLDEAKTGRPFTEGRWEEILSPGDHRVVVTSAECHPNAFNLSIKNGEAINLTVELVRIVKTERVVVTKKEIYITEKILFQTGSSKIMAVSYPILDNLVSILKDNPGLKRLLIKGHTDSRGSRNLNRKLSGDRARAVRLYLVKNGIAAERLESKGLGPDLPLVPNTTPENMEMNRRVEFEILESGL